MSERPIHLDVGMPGPRTRGEGQPHARTSDGHADPQAQQRFQQALHAPQAQAQEQTSAGEQARRLPDPMALLGARTASAIPMEASAGPDLSSLAVLIEQSVATLLVGDGRSGGQQVRMELDDELLPGVMVSIEQVEGRLQVDFVCSIERSRLLLHEQLPEFARQLAERLGRAVLVRLQTDDPEDACLYEVQAGH